MAFHPLVVPKSALVLLQEREAGAHPSAAGRVEEAQLASAVEGEGTVPVPAGNLDREGTTLEGRCTDWGSLGPVESRGVRIVDHRDRSIPGMVAAGEDILGVPGGEAAGTDSAGAGLEVVQAVEHEERLVEDLDVTGTESRRSVKAAQV